MIERQPHAILALGFVVVLAIILYLGIVPEGASAASGRPVGKAIKCVQQELNSLGFDAGTPDGSFGPKTFLSAEAYIRFMRANAEPGWDMSSLSTRNAEDWCTLLAQSHPKVERFRLELQAQQRLSADEILDPTYKFDTPANAIVPGILCVQSELNALGFSSGVPDGSLSSQTSRAAEDYRTWMINGGGNDGWNEPPLSSANGNAWCTQVALDHPVVAGLMTVNLSSAHYAADGRDGLVATFDVPTEGRIVAWELTFVFRTECENDHWASIQSPEGETVIVMDRGLHRCSGTPQVFTGVTKNAPPLLGAQAGGQWQFVFKDLDANFYSGFLMQARLELTTDDGGIVSKQTIRLNGLPKAIPNSTLSE